MKEYMLIFRNYQAAFDSLAPAELDQVLAEFLRWNEALRAEDRLVELGRLSRDPGHTLRKDSAGVVTLDGPYAEAREAIGGYYRIRAQDIEELRALAGRCPVLQYGGVVEVREVADP